MRRHDGPGVTYEAQSGTRDCAVAMRHFDELGTRVCEDAWPTSQKDIQLRHPAALAFAAFNIYELGTNQYHGLTR
jgi:hypothetical protein